MHKFAQKFADFCVGNQRIDLTQTENYNYPSLPICLIDCVYSLRAKYVVVTSPIVERYKEFVKQQGLDLENDTISKFLENIECTGGIQKFGHEILKSQSKLGGSAKIPKEQVVYKIAEYLRTLKVETMQDFQNFENQELLSVVLFGVRGFKTAGVNYLFMLCGDSDRCKPDTHVHHAIKDACNQDVSDEECQEVFADAVTILRKNYPTLTVRQLDGIIWSAYRA